VSLALHGGTAKNRQPRTGAGQDKTAIVARMMLADAAHQPTIQATATRKMAWGLRNSGRVRTDPPLSPVSVSPQVVRLRREVQKWAGLNGDGDTGVADMTNIDDLRHAAKMARLRYREAQAAHAAFGLSGAGVLA